MTFLLHKSQVSEFSMGLKLSKHIEKKILIQYKLNYTANVYTQTTDLLLFSDVVITHKNV